MVAAELDSNPLHGEALCGLNFAFGSLIVIYLVAARFCLALTV